MITSNWFDQLVQTVGLTEAVRRVNQDASAFQVTDKQRADAHASRKLFKQLQEKE